MTAPLTHDWSIIAIVEGGEVLARLDDSREAFVEVVYPEDLREDFLVEALRDKGVKVEALRDKGVKGESPGEALALFRLEYSGADL
jgi:hypothetical protein